MNCGFLEKLRYCVGCRVNNKKTNEQNKHGPKPNELLK